MSLPLLIKFQNPKIEDFVYSIFIWERALLRYFTEAGVYTFYGIGCIHDFSYGAAIVIESFYMDKIAFPYRYGSWIILPIHFELFKFLPGLVYIDGAIHLLELSGKCAPLFSWKVTDRVSNQMNNASLYSNVRKNSFSAFLQTRNAGV